jgi:hypothetical protein
MSLVVRGRRNKGVKLTGASPKAKGLCHRDDPLPRRHRAPLDRPALPPTLNAQIPIQIFPIRSRIASIRATITLIEAPDDLIWEQIAPTQARFAPFQAQIAPTRARNAPLWGKIALLSGRKTLCRGPVCRRCEPCRNGPAAAGSAIARPRAVMLSDGGRVRGGRGSGPGGWSGARGWAEHRAVHRVGDVLVHFPVDSADNRGTAHGRASQMKLGCRPDMPSEMSRARPDMASHGHKDGQSWPKHARSMAKQDQTWPATAARRRRDTP